VVADDDPLALGWATVGGVASVTSVVGEIGAVTGADILADTTVAAALAEKADTASLGTAAALNSGTASGTVPVLGTGGRLAVARLASGTPDGTQYVRDDGTLAVPPGSVTSVVGEIGAVTGADVLADETVAGALSAKADTASLGGAAVLDVGTTTGTVSAGDDARMTNARTPTAHAASHGAGQSDAITVTLAQVSDAGTAAAAAATAFDTAGAAASAQSAAIAASAQRTSNLSDLASPRTARANLGLTEAAAMAAAEPPLSVLLAALATRASTPCRVVFAGSSTTVGTGASDTAHSYVSLLVAALQNAYPSGTGSEAAVVASTTATWGTPSEDPGVHGFNMAESGTTSANYFTSDERTSTAALAPACIVHMIGANDFSTGVVPATTGSNVATVVNGMKALVSTPMVQVLAHSYQRMDVAEPAYPWSDYMAQLQAIADADPDNVVCVDMSAVYAAVGVPGTDPWNLVNVDDIHQGDAGHALAAELLWRSLVGAPRTFGAFAPLVEAASVVEASGDAETLPDPSVYGVSDVTLTASCTFTMPSVAAAGTAKSFLVVIEQGGTGSYVPTFTGATWPDGTAPSWSTAVGAVDQVMFSSTSGRAWVGTALTGLAAP
jgi:hypothetical protein